MTAERQWVSRPYTPADAPEILDLRRVVFGDVDPIRILPDAWRWQYLENPAGTGWVRVADDHGRIVGQYAAIPTRVQVEGRGEQVFAFSCDTMTHPDYQRQGMFATLAREVYDEIAARHGVTTVWGFPNAVSHPGFVGKLGWRDICVFPVRVRPVHSRHILARYVGAGGLARALGAVVDRASHLAVRRAVLLRRCLIQRLETFDDRFDALWRRHCRIAPVVQVRDAQYLRWRYCGLPAFGYEPYEVTTVDGLVGYFVLRRVTLFGVPFSALVDLFPCPLHDAEVTREVLSFAVRDAEEHDVAFLTALLPPRHLSLLQRFGFFRVPHRLNPRPWYFGCRCAPEDAALLGAIDNWYVTYGDSDLV